jgi:hypothetical protein
MIKNIGKMIANCMNKETEIIENALRIYSKPPIKGAITMGKIRWRGIRIIRQQIGGNYRYWIEQRGIRISPIWLHKIILITI